MSNTSDWSLNPHFPCCRVLPMLGAQRYQKLSLSLSLCVYIYIYETFYPPPPSAHFFFFKSRRVCNFSSKSSVQCK